ncbi:MAG TPA: FxLYD domain-containing protein [Vicinamibacterales bacterium]|jgi:hypothetical protein|nr:FxLYD domain-containing protein [Vicinamibacterales bacterium]
MTRARFVLAATLAGSSLAGVSVLAQNPPAPEMKSVLAGKKFTPPVKGDAQIDYVKVPTRREGATLVTRITVKNTSNAPIARLRIVETWYDKDSNLIPGGDAVINGLLQPGEVRAMEIRTPVNPKMATSMLQFTHAQGGIPKPHSVKSLDAPKEPAAKNASTTKKAAPKKK